jgi:pimeloyl-ACP methyl ester carboxylesterase
MQSQTLMSLFQPEDYFLRFWRISVPTLILWGTADHVLEAKSAAVQMKHLVHPLSEGYWLDGASHAITLDSVVTIFDLSQRFLRRLPTGGYPCAVETDLLKLMRATGQFARPVESMRDVTDNPGDPLVHPKL